VARTLKRGKEITDRCGSTQTTTTYVRQAAMFGTPRRQILPIRRKPPQFTRIASRSRAGSRLECHSGAPSSKEVGVARRGTRNCRKDDAGFCPRPRTTRGKVGRSPIIVLPPGRRGSPSLFVRPRARAVSYFRIKAVFLKTL